eukprot:6126224-Amphidinium_carterae.1
MTVHEGRKQARHEWNESCVQASPHSVKTQASSKHGLHRKVLPSNRKLPFSHLGHSVAECSQGHSPRSQRQGSAQSMDTAQETHRTDTQKLVWALLLEKSWIRVGAGSNVAF